MNCLREQITSIPFVSTWFQVLSIYPNKVVAYGFIHLVDGSAQKKDKNMLKVWGNWQMHTNALWEILADAE